jgi:hypothetical protein
LEFSEVQTKDGITLTFAEAFFAYSFRKQRVETFLPFSFLINELKHSFYGTNQSSRYRKNVSFNVGKR